MLSKQIKFVHPVIRLAFLLTLFIFAGCGGGDSHSKPASPSDSGTPKFSLPLPKGIAAPAPDSDLTLTARAVIDPGSSGEKTFDLTVDLSGNRVTGVIDGVPVGPHTVEIQYFMNQVQIAKVTLNATVVGGQNTSIDADPASIQYVEAVSDALFVADATDLSIQIFDQYSKLSGGLVQAAPSRILKPTGAGVSGPSVGGLFVEAIGGGLYVANLQANSVTIWKNAATATGILLPDRTVSGDATRLNQPSGIAVDPFRDRLYVVNKTGEILIWTSASSLNGTVAPATVVAGPSTGLVAGDHPLFLDVKRDTLYVANGTEIRIYEKLSRLTGNQDVAPVRTIRVAGKNLSQAGIAADLTRDLLFVSSQDTNGTVYRLANGSTASQDVAPAAILSGAETGLNQPSALTLANDVLMALNQGGSNLQVWHQVDQKNGSASPTQILSFSPTTVPVALFYVATQNGPRDQAQVDLTIQKNGKGTVISDVPGINCGTTCSAQFPTGSQVTLTAVAEAGFTFVSFGGDCASATSSCKLTLTADAKVTAAFNDIQAPSTPSNLVATVASATQIELSWILSVDNVGTSGYWVERCQGAGCTNFARVNTSLITDNRFSDTGLTSGVVYRYRVQAVDAAGNLSPYSNVVTVSTLDSIAPSTPTNLTATPAASGTQINLSWTASTDNVGVSGYWIERCQGATCTNFARVNTTLVAATTFNDTGLTSAATYRYQVQASDAAGNLSPYSSIVNATTPDTVPPTPPTNLTATSPAGATGGSQINLSWTASTDNVRVRGYWIERCQGAGCTSFSRINTALVNAVSFNDTGLTNGTSYSYRVQAADAAGNVSGYSNIATASTNDTQAPTPPASLTATAASDSQINLSWSSSSDNIGVTGYRVERCQGAGCNTFTQIATPTETTYSDTNLSGATSYSYRVRATDAAGNLSTYSNTASATTAANPVLTVKVSGTGAGTVSSAPTGISSCATTCSASFISGTSVTLTAGASAGSTVAGFSGCTSTATTCTFTITGNTTVTVTFNDTQPPTAPLNLTSTPISDSQINLSWSPSTDNMKVTGYFLERCQGTGCSNFTQITTVSGSPFSDTNLSGATSYSYRVQATDAAGNLSTYSNTASATTAANPVLTVNKSGTGAGTVTSSAGINSAISCGSTCSASFTSGTSVTLTATASAGSTVASFSGGCTSTATTCTFTITGNTTITVTFSDTQAPTPPTNLTATSPAGATGGSQINLSWTASTDNVRVRGYWIERCQGAGCTSFSRINTALVNAVSFNDTGLTNGTSYSYRVQAADAAGNVSGYSNIATASTNDTQAPTPPASLTATAASDSQINLSWSSSSDNIGVTGYRVERCQGSGCSNFAQIATLTGTNYNDTGLISATSYSYRVRATDAAGNLSEYSSVATATTPDSVPPTAPAGLTANTISSSEIDLSWTASTDNVGVSGYWIERCQGVGCTGFARINTSLMTATNYSDTGLTSGTTYSYRVQAADAAGNPSAYSDIVSATTLQTFTLTVVVDAAVGAGGHVAGPGIDCGTDPSQADCSEVYSINTSVILNALPDSLSQSSGWTGCDSTTSPTSTTPATCTININSDKEVHAAFSLLPITP